MRQGQVAGPDGDEGVEQPGQQPRQHAESKHQGDQGPEHGQIEAGEIGEPARGRRLRPRPVKDPLPEGEQEKGGGEKPETGRRRRPGGGAPDAAKDQELPDKSVEPGKAQRREKGDSAKACEITRRRRAHSAEVAQAAPAAVERDSNPPMQ